MERRNCCKVIKDMMSNIPSDKSEFIKDLEWNFEDASYKAPEETLQWERTMQTLIKHIPVPKEDWEFEVLSIFTTKPIETLRSEVDLDEDRKAPPCAKSNFSDLKVGDTIRLLQSGEDFIIDKIFEDGSVDMTATKQYNPEMGFNWHENFFSIKLVNFEIVSKNHKIMDESQKENWECLKYRKKEEGFDYCFEGYSNWKEIDDPIFHELREAYLNARKKLNDYIDGK
jgi:hypothetical protein